MQAILVLTAEYVSQMTDFLLPQAERNDVFELDAPSSYKYHSNTGLHSNQAESRVGQASACPVCDYRTLIHQPEHNLTACTKCEHIFQSDLRVTAVYDSAYAHQYDERPHREMSKLRWDFIQQTLALPPGSKILDVGYGNGSFLKHAQHFDMNIYGIDLHNEDFGVPEVGYDSDIEFDLVCFFDSIEHFVSWEQPLSLRTKNAIVSVPAQPNFMLRSPRSWRHFKPGEHLHYFSDQSLAHLMEDWGLPCLRAQGNPEDALRGTLAIDGLTYSNIYTAIFSRDRT